MNHTLNSHDPKALVKKGVRAFVKRYGKKIDRWKKLGVKELGRIPLKSRTGAQQGVSILVLPTTKARYVKVAAKRTPEVAYTGQGRSPDTKRQINPQRKLTLGNKVQLKEANLVPDRTYLDESQAWVREGIPHLDMVERQKRRRFGIWSKRDDNRRKVQMKYRREVRDKRPHSERAKRNPRYTRRRMYRRFRACEVDRNLIERRKRYGQEADLDKRTQKDLREQNRVRTKLVLRKKYALEEDRRKPRSPRFPRARWRVPMYDAEDARYLRMYEALDDRIFMTWMDNRKRRNQLISHMDETGRRERPEVQLLLNSVDRTLTIPNQKEEVERLDKRRWMSGSDQKGDGTGGMSEGSVETLPYFPQLTNLFQKPRNLYKESSLLERGPVSAKRGRLSYEERKELDPKIEEREGFLKARIQESTRQKRDRAYIELGKVLRHGLQMKANVDLKGGKELKSTTKSTTKSTQLTLVEGSAQTLTITKGYEEIADERRRVLERERLTEDRNRRNLPLLDRLSSPDERNKVSRRWGLREHYEANRETHWVEGRRVWMTQFLRNPWLRKTNQDPRFPWFTEEVNRSIPRLRIQNHPRMELEYQWFHLTQHIEEVRKKTRRERRQHRRQHQRLLGLEERKEGERGREGPVEVSAKKEVKKLDNPFWRHLTKDERRRKQSFEEGRHYQKQLPQTWDEQEVRSSAQKGLRYYLAKTMMRKPKRNRSPLRTRSQMKYRGRSKVKSGKKLLSSQYPQKGRQRKTSLLSQRRYEGGRYSEESRVMGGKALSGGSGSGRAYGVGYLQRRTEYRALVVEEESGHREGNKVG